jgi:AMP-polyphosphate phosphotransferase
MAALDEVDLKLTLSKEDGADRLVQAQQRLLALRLQSAGLIGTGELGPPLLVLFEGWDASGKGGAIRRLTSPLDPRHVAVSEFSAPTEVERRHHFLWRFWPHIPGWGDMSVFDRTWYGRVLVERVDGLAAKQEYKRAYQEIVEFEQGLCDEGVVLLKFWMHISDEEQLSRFEARANDPLKRWKLTDEDWHNREKRDRYEKAIEKMLKHTDHEDAPWTLIAAENKPYARVVVLETVIAAVQDGLLAAGMEPVSTAVED